MRSTTSSSRLRSTVRGPAVLAALVALVGAPAARAQTPTALSLNDAIQLALGNNPDYLSQRNQLRSAEWNVRSAYGSWLPSLSATSGFGYTATGERRFDTVVLDEQPSQYSSRYSLNMSLSLNGNTLLAPSVARAQARATEQQVNGAAESLVADVTQRYLMALEARDAVTQAERELARAEAHLTLARARLEVGSGTQLEVSRAEVQRGQAEVRLIQAQNNAANEILMLSQAVGRRLPIEVSLTERFELFEPRWTAEELTELALSRNPGLLASRAQADAASTRARAARTSYLPTVSFSAGLSGYVAQAGNTDPLVAQELQRAQSSFASCMNTNEIRTRVGLDPLTCIDPATPGFEDEVRRLVEARNSGFPFDYIRQPASASVSISLPIFTGFSRQQQIEEANIARLNAQHQVRAQELRIGVEVESALRNLETAYRSALLQQRVRQNAEDELRLAEERFRFGATTSVEVVDAQASLAEAERAEIAAIYAFHRSLAALKARVGGELP